MVALSCHGCGGQIVCTGVEAETREGHQGDLSDFFLRSLEQNEEIVFNTAFSYIFQILL